MKLFLKAFFVKGTIHLPFKSMIESMIVFTSTVMVMGLFSCIDLNFSINEEDIEFVEDDEEDSEGQ